VDVLQAGQRPQGAVPVARLAPRQAWLPRRILLQREGLF